MAVHWARIHFHFAISDLWGHRRWEIVPNDSVLQTHSSHHIPEWIRNGARFRGWRYGRASKWHPKCGPRNHSEHWSYWALILNSFRHCRHSFIAVSKDSSNSHHSNYHRRSPEWPTIALSMHRHRHARTIIWPSPSTVNCGSWRRLQLEIVKLSIIWGAECRSDQPALVTCIYLRVWNSLIVFINSIIYIDCVYTRGTRVNSAFFCNFLRNRLVHFYYLL